MFRYSTNAAGKHVLETDLRGKELLMQPLLNKNTAFTDEERTAFKLHGLLPPEIDSLDVQFKRAYSAYSKKQTDLGRHIYLRSLQDRDETLFYQLLVKHIGEMLPMVYTPTVGLACQHFHEIYRQPRGLFLSYPNRERMEEMIANIDLPDVQVIVVSDGERILGLGDQGAGGMGIPIGKISLYTACGGIFPGFALPILLDTGTDNQERLNDPLYLGWRHKRIRGKEYDNFVDRFVTAIVKRYPKVLLQWEDFAKDNAHKLLNRYKDRLCTFNDDIQGTAAVTLAGLLSAVKVAKSSLEKQTIVIYGAGSAGTGIADQIASAMAQHGLTLAQAQSRIYLIDRDGLVLRSHPNVASFQKPYAKDLPPTWRTAQPNAATFDEVIDNAQPTILIGVSGAANAFTETSVKKMASHTPHPIIFPLSNPTALCEATPQDLLTWTHGKALVATGTKFPDVTLNGTTYKIAQCNNYYIFPAMGLAVLAARATRVTDAMFLAAAETLAPLSPALATTGALLFPPPEQVRSVAKILAHAIGLAAQQDGVAPPTTPEELQQRIDATFWSPEYSALKPI